MTHYLPHFCSRSYYYSKLDYYCYFPHLLRMFVALYPTAELASHCLTMTSERANLVVFHCYSEGRYLRAGLPTNDLIDRVTLSFLLARTCLGSFWGIAVQSLSCHSGHFDSWDFLTRKDWSLSDACATIQLVSCSLSSKCVFRQVLGSRCSAMDYSQHWSDCLIVTGPTSCHR